MKKIISLALCFLMIFNIFPIKTFAEEKSLEEIIRPQVEAFAKSIDQPNANKKAQDIIIGHGISGNGKKLSVGKSHALTATIANSELTKEYLTKVCVVLIETANEMNMDKIYSVCGNVWKINRKNSYQIYIYDYDAETGIYTYKYWDPRSRYDNEIFDVDGNVIDIAGI